MKIVHGHQQKAESVALLQIVARNAMQIRFWGIAFGGLGVGRTIED